ncbi:hypothetical protein [Moraxella lacunata]|uniref:hypothetical protein n=1 Tax=Moraxella lacunata TaxID=477 RepID=UPI003EE405C4
MMSVMALMSRALSMTNFIKILNVYKNLTWPIITNFTPHFMMAVTIKQIQAWQAKPDSLFLPMNLRLAVH